MARRRWPAPWNAKPPNYERRVWMISLIGFGLDVVTRLHK